MIFIGEHKNVVNLMGACTKSRFLYIITEYCPHGNVQQFLRTRREKFQLNWFKNEEDMETELTYIDITQIAYQVARGMDFLASKQVRFQTLFCHFIGYRPLLRIEKGVGWIKNVI